MVPKHIKVIGLCILAVAGLTVLSFGFLRPTEATGQMTLLSQAELNNWWAAGTYEKAKCEKNECGTDDGNCDGEDSSCNSGNLNEMCHIYKDYTKRKVCECKPTYTTECNYTAERCWQKYECKCVTVGDCGSPVSKSEHKNVLACGTW